MFDRSIPVRKSFCIYGICLLWEADTWWANSKGQTKNVLVQKDGTKNNLNLAKEKQLAQVEQQVINS